jgi:hypothetical protein
MKPFVILCVLGLAAATAFVPVEAAAHRTIHVNCDSDDTDNLFRGDDVDVDIEDGSITFTHEDDDETVEITGKGDLYVNGEAVSLSPDQRDLVVEYYETFDGIIEEAKLIACEGAKIGVKGAGLGIHAALGALLALGDEEDLEDLEEKLERKGEKIERMAKRLERRADRLEAKAESLEGLHKQLRNDIDALDDTGWF